MAKKHDQTEEVLEGVEQTLTRTELFLEKNKKPLGIAVGVIVALVMIGYAYSEYYSKPKNLQAQNEIFRAQKYMEQDSLRLALNGDGINMGFLDVANEYSGTQIGKTANYYAGVCYLNMGKYEEAITYLDKFSGNDEVLTILAKAGIGDAFLELKQPKEALDYYKKAINAGNNEFAVPFVLFKAAQVAELEGDNALALEYYSRIKNDFDSSREAADIEKYIARVETKMN